MTASAPARRYLTTCSAVSTPLVAASERSSVPASSAIHSSGNPVSWRVLSFSSALTDSVLNSKSGW